MTHNLPFKIQYILDYTKRDRWFPLLVARSGKERGPVVKTPYVFDFTPAGEWNHYLGGRADFKGICPSCKKDLMLHALLDLSDPKLKPLAKIIKEPFLPLYYCMQCPICWFPFQYQFSGKEIEPVSWGISENEAYLEQCLAEWKDSGMPTDGAFEKHPFQITEISPALYSLVDKAFRVRWHNLEDEEYQKLLQVWNPYDDFGGLNQIGGKLFFIQGPPPPVCYGCGNSMTYLSSMSNVFKKGIRITLEAEYQILFAICPKCGIIGVRHSCS